MNKNQRIIFDNIIFSLQNVGGISNYWTKIIYEILKTNKIEFYECKHNNILRKKINLKTFRESIISAKILRYMPFLKRLPSKSIFHSSYLRTTFQKDVVNITTIHDFTYEYFEKGLSKFIHSWQKNLSIKNADGIICVSNNTKKDLFKFVPNLNKKKVLCIYNGVDDDFFQIKNLKNKIKDNQLKKLSKKKIVLFVGNRRKLYKNFFLAIDTISLLKDVTLVSVGGEEINQEEKNYINKKIKGRFCHFSKINIKKLNKIYNLSFCLLYPSLYEGFGLPLIEAMKAGCPVISTNSSSIKEIAKNSAVLVNKPKKEEFAKAIELIKDNKLRNKLIQKGLINSKKFSWKKCANETLNFYEKIYNIKFN